MPKLFAYSVYSGDAIPLTLQFYQADGTTPLDLTGRIIGTTIKLKATDLDADALFQKDIAGDPTGVISYLIPGLDVGGYWIDVKSWDVALGYQRSTVIGSQKFQVEQSVTLRATPTVTLVLGKAPLQVAA
jgi:hypothetical protein